MLGSMKPTIFFSPQCSDVLAPFDHKKEKLFSVPMTSTLQFFRSLYEFWSVFHPIHHFPQETDTFWLKALNKYLWSFILANNSLEYRHTAADLTRDLPIRPIKVGNIDTVKN